MDMLKAIYTRRSVRKFTDRPVDDELLTKIIDAGRWAPSGLNNQPWRFAVVRDINIKDELASLTKYSKIIEGAPACIAVFIDTEAMYNDIKDHQSIGACLQNMLLAAHALGLGAVWLGEILKSAGAACELLKMPASHELMAVIALGHPASDRHSSTRKELDELIVQRF